MSTLPQHRPDTRLRSLQIGRGIAAVMVVFYHLNNSIWGVPKYFPEPFSPLLASGKAGVQFFFVLSGFIIFLMHDKDIGAADRLSAFLRKRFLRIYPAYWVVLALFITILIAEPFLGTADERRLGNFVASVLLLPWPLEPILSVAWTLKHEVMFYFVFALAIVSRRIGLIVFVLWQLGCVINAVLGVTVFPWSVLFSPNNLLFSMGMLAAYLFKARLCPRPGLVALIGAVGFAITAVHQTHAMLVWPLTVYILLYGLSSTVLVLGAATYESQHGLRAPEILDAIGDASYSIYLIHLPLLSALAKALFTSSLAMQLPQSMSMVGFLVCVLGVGLAFSRWVEMPLIAMLGRLWSSPRRVDAPLRA
jgi:peptidoglycan/LPS O-acetylase OafA/YrhL